MKQVVTKNLTIRFSENINYAWVFFNGPCSNQDFNDSLAEKEFQDSLKENATDNLLLDCSRLDRFSIPEMSDYIDQHFIPDMKGINIKKISVLIDESVLSMLQFVFQQIKNNHSTALISIEFFQPNQFHQSSEAVEWFN